MVIKQSISAHLVNKTEGLKTPLTSAFYQLKIEPSMYIKQVKDLQNAGRQYILIFYEKFSTFVYSVKYTYLHEKYQVPIFKNK